MIREEKGGVTLESGSLRVTADARSARDGVHFVSHAHLDHVNTSAESFVSSEVTRELAGERTGSDFGSEEHSSVRLLPSGHIMGSRAALVESEEDVLYTGDFSPRERLYLDGFDPPSADVLVIESTYGVPAYRFPGQRELESRISDWLHDNRGCPLFLFGYSLGKAQKIQRLVERETARDIVAHGAVMRMNRAVERLTELEFSALPYGENKGLLEEGEAVFVGPPGFARRDSLRELVERCGGVTAGFTGWAAGGRNSRRYHRSFPMSDHADFDELVETVKEVDPQKVYTTHGFSAPFASYLRSELGYDAVALEENQSRLGEFCPD